MTVLSGEMLSWITLHIEAGFVSVPTSEIPSIARQKAVAMAERAIASVNA